MMMQNQKAFEEIMETLEFGRAADEDTMSPCYARVYPDQVGYAAVGISVTVGARTKTTPR